MTNVIIYRADDYTNSIGNLVGFYEDIEDAKQNLECREPSPSCHQYPHSQITAFKVDSKLAEALDLKDNERMLEEDVWGSGEIVSNYYYV